MVRRWTAKAAIDKSRRNIDGAIERLRQVAYEWGDIDQTFVDRADEFVRDLEQWRDDIATQIQERLDAGEEIGI